MILCIENPEDSTRKLLEFINEFGKFAEYKINIQKFVAFLYVTANYQPEIKETIPFTIASKRIKYIGKKIYLRRQKMSTLKTVKHRCKNLKIAQIKERYTILLDWKNQYC